MSAIDTTTELGQIDDRRLREVHASVAEAHELLLDDKVLDQTKTLITEIAARAKPE
ncbi:MAG: hypothetical protein QM648_11495 [Solirubrobacterales bacterium]